jgi:hypothetical protein
MNLYFEVARLEISGYMYLCDRISPQGSGNYRKKSQIMLVEIYWLLSLEEKNVAVQLMI